MLSITEAGVAAIIAAACSGAAAIMGGIAAIIAARHRRETRAAIAVPNNGTPGPPATIGETAGALEHRLGHLEGQLTEHLAEVEAMAGTPQERAELARRLRELLEERGP